MRDQFRDSPYYAACAEFCEKYDAPAFDPAYDSDTLEFFEPMVMRLCSYPRTSIYKKAMVEEAAGQLISSTTSRRRRPTAWRMVPHAHPRRPHSVGEGQEGAGQL